MITSIWFDDVIVVRGGKDHGGAIRGDLRDQSFHAADGWDIRETLPGVFSLSCEGMEHPVEVGGYGWSCIRVNVEEPHPFADEEAPVAGRVTVQGMDDVIRHAQGKRKGKR